jgi:16S rRNA (cytidine1402-2'-O)-methyltransferase
MTIDKRPKTPSEINPSKGIAGLFLLGNSLGLDDDVPSRTKVLIRSADLIIGEEDRPIRQMLRVCGVFRDYLRLSEHSQKETLAAAEEALQAGKQVVYFSDQGMPGVADPGRELIEIAQRHQVQIRVIPGPSSITAAIASCPFDCSQFLFAGFLPRSSEDREATLQKLIAIGMPIIVLETPYRLRPFVESLNAILAKGHRIHLVRDLSGPCEDHMTTTVENLINVDFSLKLNFVMIIDRAENSLAALATQERPSRHEQRKQNPGRSPARSNKSHGLKRPPAQRKGRPKSRTNSQNSKR